MKPPSLLIAVPCRDFLRSETWPALAYNGFVESALYWKKTYGWDAKVHLVARPGTHVHVARNELAEIAIVRGYTWTLWLDDDAAPPERLLERLMESGKDFIAPIFTTKKHPYKPCCFKKVDGHMLPILEIDPPRLFEADATGFHTVLIKNDVFRKTQDWIWENYPPERSALFQMNSTVSEDIFFCNAAKLAGHELWIDSRIEVGHGAEYIATPGHFRAARDSMHKLLQQAPTVANYA